MEGNQQHYAKLLEDALSKDLKNALSVCEEFELDFGGTADVGVALPFYRVQLMAYLLDDLTSAQWLWQRMPAAAKSDPELQSMWKIAQTLWHRDFSSAFTLFSSVKWPAPLSAMAVQIVEDLRTRNAALIARSHKTIAVQECATLLGLSEADTIARCKGLGWAVREQDGVLLPVEPPSPPVGPAGHQHLHFLTDLVCKLDTH